MADSEFPRLIDVRQCDGRTLSLTASKDECAALAARFDLVRIERLEAEIALNANGQTVAATGTVQADFVQRCAVSAEDLPASISEDVTLRFVPASRTPAQDEELEINADDCDEIEYTGTTFDLGEAVAQSFALAIDPFATGPEADAARTHYRAEEAGPFAALAGLRTDSEKPRKN